MTNYERIKRMSLNEMTEFLGNVGSCSNCSRNGCGDCCDVDDCNIYIREWLDQEAEETPNTASGSDNAFVTLVQEQNAEIDRLRELLEEAAE